MSIELESIEKWNPALEKAFVIKCVMPQHCMIHLRLH